MQNWNQWQLPTASPITAPMPQPPIGYAAPGADPMATMQSYMQYYNQPAPSGYTAEQWAAAQQQNWAQWQTWQQQYQQWQAQYGEKYQETMKQMSTQNLSSLTQAPPSSHVQPPPLPKEDSAKPPLPPEQNAFGFPGMPPPHQNNLPLFPSGKSSNPPLPPGQPPLPSANSRNPSVDNNPSVKRVANSSVESGSAKKLKVEDEELTEAEKTFDAQFKQWEEQFNKWKQQNANHPDKTQYKQYEAKWTSWREKLIERREQMRRKREQQKQAAAKAEAEKEKSLVGDDKILNLLSSTENQGLINNLLGIGKTLGLTGKNESPQTQSQVPTVPTSAAAAIAAPVAPTSMGAPTMTPNMNQAAWAAQQWAAQYNPGMNMSSFSSGYQHPPAISQVATNPLPNPMTMTNFNQPPTNFSQPPTNFNQPPANFNQPPASFTQQQGNYNQPQGNFNHPPGNFNQPPPNILGPGTNFSNAPPNVPSGGPNFSQPPPGFGPSNSQQRMDSASAQRSEQGNPQDQNMRPFRPDGKSGQSTTTENPSRDSMGSGNDRYSFEGNRFSGPPPNDLGSSQRGDRFGSNMPYERDGSNKDFSSGHQLGSGSDNNRQHSSGRDFSPGGRASNEFRSGDPFGSVFDRDQGGNRSSRDGDNQDNRGDNYGGSDRNTFNPDRFGANNDRLGSGSQGSGCNNDRFNTSNDRFNTSNSRFNSSSDRFNTSNDRLGPNNDRFGPNNDRLGPNNDRFGPNNDRSGPNNDRFGSNDDRFGPNNDRFGSSNDRFGSSNDQFKPDNDRFGSSNDRFRSSNESNFGTTSGDRFGSSNDRPSMANLGPMNDKFNRPPPDRFGSRDGSRDSFGSSSRGFGRNNQFEPPADMPPELQKLMAKRRAAMDVFKPSTFSSLLDSTKIDTSASLSESFRKITGDSPFLSRSSTNFTKQDSSFGSFDSPRDHRAGDSSSFKYGGPGEFRPSGGGGGGGGGDFPLRGMGDFSSRGNEFNTRQSRDFSPRANEFGSKDPGNFGSRGMDFGPRGSDPPKDSPRRLGDSGQRTNNEFGSRSGMEFEASNRNEQSQSQTNESSDHRAPPQEKSQRMPTPTREGPSSETRKDPEENSKSNPPDSAKSKDDATQQNVPPLEMPPWMGSEFANDAVAEESSDKPIEKERDSSISAPQENFEAPPNAPASDIDAEESKNKPAGSEKKSDALPFMGENDPKPEDLNMEPPPELPNLGPIIKDSKPEPESKRHNTDEPFRRPTGESNRKMNTDAPFAASGMQIKPRGPMPFGSRGPDDSHPPPFGPRDIGDDSKDNMKPSGPFGSHSSNEGLPFGPRGPQNDSFKPGGQSLGGPFGPRGPAGFGPRGPGDFGPRGPGAFDSRGPNDFGPRGPGDFGPRGPPAFGPQGPGDFGPPGPADFGPRGPTDFRSHGPTAFGPRGPSDFGPRGPSDFGPRGPPDFGPRGPPDFGPCGPSDFGPRDANDRQLGAHGSTPFGPRGPLASGSNEPPFGPKPPFGSNAFAPRANPDNPVGGIPSLMSFKFDRPANPAEETPAPKSNDFASNRCDDLPPAFRKGDQDQRPFGVDEHRSDGNPMDQGPDLKMARGPAGPDWRDSFGRNKFGDSDQRSGPPEFGASSMRPDNQMPLDRDRSGFGPGDEKIDLRSLDKNIQPPGRAMNLPFDDPFGSNKDHSGGSNFIARRSTERSGNSGNKEFCVEKQFNYNHSGGMPDEISKEHSSANVIDYAHAPRVIVHDYVTPAQCFDYGHGCLKPIVPEHEIYSKKDFRNWIESEQNLREYTDRMRTYESDMRALKRGFNQRQPDVRVHYREHSRTRDDRRSYDRDRRPLSSRNDRGRRDRDSDDYRERDRRRGSRDRARIERDREWERSSNKNRDERSHHRRSKSKDRTREKTEKLRRETNKENKKDDERSKGNVTGSDTSAKKPEESTAPDNSKHEIKDGDSEEPPRNTEETISEVPQLPTTMELPKTPNFTMVDDLLCQPGRQNRPPKIVVILRGPPGSGKSFVAKLIKDKEVEQGGSAPRILSLDDYFLTEKEIESEDNNGKKVTTKEMVYEYEEAMEPSYITSLIKAFKKNIVDGFFNFIILDSINEKISDYEEMWSFAKTKGFRVYVCEMEMDVQICLKRNIHKRTEDEINRIVDYFEPTPGYHQKLDVTSMLQEEAIEEVHMEEAEDAEEEPAPTNDDSQDSQEEPQDSVGVSKWERMEAEDKLDRLDGLAKKKHESKPQTMEDFLQVPDYYNMEDTSGKRRVRWADLEERKEQEKMRAVGFVVGQTNWDRMMDPTKGGSALTRTKYI